MKEIKKTVIEEAQGMPGFLIPEEVMPTNLINYYGLNTAFKISVQGKMVEIEGIKYFQVEKWQMGR